MDYRHLSDQMHQFSEALNLFYDLEYQSQLYPDKTWDELKNIISEFKPELVRQEIKLLLLEENPSTLYDFLYDTYIEPFKDDIPMLHVVITNEIDYYNPGVNLTLRQRVILDLDKKIQKFLGYVEEVKLLQPKQIARLKTYLTRDQANKLYEKLLEKKFIGEESSKEIFCAIFFGDIPQSEFKPVPWLKAKNSLRVLLELLSRMEKRNGKYGIPSEVENNIIPHLFSYRKGGKMKLYNNKKADNNADCVLIEKIVKEL